MHLDAALAVDAVLAEGVACMLLSAVRTSDAALGMSEDLVVVAALASMSRLLSRERTKMGRSWARTSGVSVRWQSIIWDCAAVVAMSSRSHSSACMRSLPPPSQSRLSSERRKSERASSRLGLGIVVKVLMSRAMRLEWRVTSRLTAAISALQCLAVSGREPLAYGVVIPGYHSIMG